MTEPIDPVPVVQKPIRVPGVPEISENGPVVIVGPNGSGKSRRSREITSDGPIEVISALRNTRISPQLQPMALNQARANFVSQRETARNQPYELTNDFDFMLTALIGEALDTSLDYLQRARTGEQQDLPPLASLEKIQFLWGELFPGRELRFREYMPVVINTVAVGDEPAQYSAWQMSDGEKAALYLAGRALAADPGGVLLVDEPETHLHSLLAVQFWDAVERERPDLRFIYVTHDMTFAASRRAIQYLLASPHHGLTPIRLASDAGDLAAVLLGTASLSFYATTIVFCEGEPDSLDWRLYSGWFNDKNVVVQAVGSCDMVLRSVSALRASDLVQNLTVKGLIDRDLHSDDRLSMLPEGVHALGVHEVESLFALPDVVAAVAKHLGRRFDAAEYERSIVAAYSDADRHRVALERWKMRVERELAKVVSSVQTRTGSLENITASLTEIFDQDHWSFSPRQILADEKAAVEGLFGSESPDVQAVLRIMPGKPLRGIAPGVAGLKPSAYDDLVVNALRGEMASLKGLGRAVRNALAPFMP